MDIHHEKLSLLSELIEFAKVDGELHEREMEFLALVAAQLKIEKPEFLGLFRQQADVHVIKSETLRIHQFYRLALLMHCDGHLDEQEYIAIKQLGINMGLSPFATNRILELMKYAPNGMLTSEEVYRAFKEQQN
jgi:hypothetical protein